MLKTSLLQVVAGGVIAGHFEGTEQIAFPVSVTLHREFIPR